MPKRLWFREHDGKQNSSRVECIQRNEVTMYQDVRRIWAYYFQRATHSFLVFVVGSKHVLSDLISSYHHTVSVSCDTYSFPRVSLATSLRKLLPEITGLIYYFITFTSSCKTFHTQLVANFSLFVQFLISVLSRGNFSRNNERSCIDGRRACNRTFIA